MVTAYPTLLSSVLISWSLNVVLPKVINTSDSQPLSLPLLPKKILVRVELHGSRGWPSKKSRHSHVLLDKLLLYQKVRLSRRTKALPGDIVPEKLGGGK